MELLSHMDKMDLPQMKYITTYIAKRVNIDKYKNEYFHYCEYCEMYFLPQDDYMTYECDTCGGTLCNDCLMHANEIRCLGRCEGIIFLCHDEKCLQTKICYYCESDKKK